VGFGERLWVLFIGNGKNEFSITDELLSSKNILEISLAVSPGLRKP
jgi:hypothetical protein